MSVPASTNRFVLIGPAGDNECCACGFLGDQEDSGGHSCSGVCDAPNTWLYGNSDGDPPGTHPTDSDDFVPCFPQSCCPCPPTGTDRKVMLYLTTINSDGLESCAEGGLDEEVELLGVPDGISICSGWNPPSSVK